MTTKTNRSVTLSTRTVGQSFGTAGLCRDARTGRIVGRSETTRPYGYTTAALSDAAALAERRGWTVVEAE